MSSETTLEDKISEIMFKVEEYTYERSICVSFYNYGASVNGLKVVIQPDIISSTVSTKVKTPDLLIIMESEFVILDVKDLHTSSKKTFDSTKKDLLEYAGEWAYDHQIFVPHLVMCVPKGKVKRKDVGLDISVVDFDVDNSEIKLSIISNNGQASKLFGMFQNDSLVFPLDTSPIHFLRTEPPISYVAERVYSLLQVAAPPDLSKPEYYQVKLKTFVKTVQNIFPPSLSSRTGNLIPQLAEGRVRRALAFLERDKFVSLHGEFIRFPRNRGGGTGDLLEHFIKIQAKDELEAEEKKRKIAAKQAEVQQAIASLDPSQTRLFDPRFQQSL